MIGPLSFLSITARFSELRIYSIKTNAKDSPSQCYAFDGMRKYNNNKINIDRIMKVYIIITVIVGK